MAKAIAFRPSITFIGEAAMYEKPWRFPSCIQWSSDCSASASCAWSLSKSSCFSGKIIIRCEKKETRGSRASLAFVDFCPPGKRRKRDPIRVTVGDVLKMGDGRLRRIARLGRCTEPDGRDVFVAGLQDVCVLEDLPEGLRPRSSLENELYFLGDPNTVLYIIISECMDVLGRASVAHPETVLMCDGAGPAAPPTDCRVLRRWLRRSAAWATDEGVATFVADECGGSLERFADEHGAAYLPGLTEEDVAKSAAPAFEAMEHAFEAMREERAVEEAERLEAKRQRAAEKRARHPRVDLVQSGAWKATTAAAEETEEVVCQESLRR